MTKNAAKFDLNALDTIEACNKPAEIEIKHPVSGAPTGIHISVLGRDSDAYRGIVRGMADETLRKQALGRVSAADASLDKLERKNIDALVAATTGWRDGEDRALELDGDRLEFTPDNARRVYTRFPWLRDQVGEAINDLGNFLPA